MPEQYASVGHVVQIIGPVVDIQFDADKLPPIYNAIHITSEGYNIPQPLDVIAEVQRHLGEGRVRAVAMEPTEGMVRGMKAYDTGKPIIVPVGRPTLGRVMNVLGKPVDQLGPLTSDTYYPIHRPAPTLEDQSTTLEMFETGIKVVDLMEPYLKGGKIGLFGGAGVGKIPRRAHLRPDDRAAWVALARRPYRPDRCRILARRGASRRAPVHRQHL